MEPAPSGTLECEVDGIVVAVDEYETAEQMRAAETAAATMGCAFFPGERIPFARVGRWHLTPDLYADGSDSLAEAIADATGGDAAAIDCT